MSRNAIAFISGLGTGMLQAKKSEKDDERQAKKDAREDELHAARMDDIKRRQQEQDALANAGKSAVVDMGSGGALKPETMDNRDVGLAENANLPNAGLSTMPYRVNGKPMATQAEADAAAQQYNTPQARTQRTAAALYGVGKPVEAMQLEQGAKAAQVADIKLADEKWRRDLGVSMQGGHDGIAGLASSSEVGLLQGRQLKAVKNPDGTVTYNRVGADGKLVPDPRLTFPDTEEGVIKAAFTLDKLISPQDRMKHYEDQKKAEKADMRADRSFDLQVNADKRAANADARAERADGRAAASAARSASTERMNPGERKLKETEFLLGRPLTQAEREKLAGFSTKGDGSDKSDLEFATDIAKEAVKAGTVGPEAAAGVRQGVINQIQGGRQMEKVRTGLSKARKDGTMNEAVAELRSKGMTDEAIASLGGDVPKPPPAEKKRGALAASAGLPMTPAPQPQVNPAIDRRAPGAANNFSIPKAVRSILPVDEELRKRINAGTE